MRVGKWFTSLKLEPPFRRNKMGTIDRLKHDLDVHVIVTFENQVDQVVYYQYGWIWNPRFSKYIKRVAPNHSYNGKYQPQKHIMERIYNYLVENGHDVTDVMKISLSYKTPDYVKRDTKKELWKSGYGIMMQGHQYYFQPDQRNYVTEDLVETFGFGKNIKPAKDMDYNRHKMNLVLKENQRRKLQR